MKTVIQAFNHKDSIFLMANLSLEKVIVEEMVVSKD